MIFQNFRSDTTYYQPENAWCLGQAARLAYEDPTATETRCREWGLTMTRFLKSPRRARYDTQAFVAANDRLVVVAFRGTEPKKLQDWLTDVNAVLIRGPFGGRVHAGFYLALESVWKDLLKALRESQTRGQSLWFTGHSLGGALASLAVARLRDEFDRPVHGLYTFGQPRVGDRIFERAYNQDNRSRSFRFVNNNDVVTRVPTRLMGYSHIGTFLYFDHQGRLQRDPHYWFQFLDRVEGRIEDLGKPLSDGLKDHFMEAYLDRLEKNRAVDPF
jgi:pimeloyl-ACP methyl ester carboxylesterase